MPPPSIAFCTTVKNRTQHLKLTLPRNLAEVGYGNAVFVILDYGSQDDLIPYLRAHHARDIELGRVAVYQREHDGPFRMAHAKNLAHRCGIAEGADVLVNLDADNFVSEGFAQFVAREFEQHGDRIFLWGRRVKELMPRGVTGRIAVTAQAFLKAGGYDERFETWGPDDRDFNIRLQRLHYQPQEIPPQYLNGIAHSDRLRFEEYPHVRHQAGTHESGHFYLHGSTRRIVNFGFFGCGTLHRNFDAATPVVLNRVPTRLFGVGLHKTGTTSLHQALKQLGIDSEHWPSVRWAKTVYEEMEREGRSSMLERHYAVSDLPIALLYRQLDHAYPGSKFILTEREESAWLSSVERHFERYYGNWDATPFSHQIHLALYGRKKFERRVFLDRYRRHNAEVRQYFRYRERDLLILRLEDTAREKWSKLCSFLNLPANEGEFPHVNGS